MYYLVEWKARVEGGGFLPVNSYVGEVEME